MRDLHRLGAEAMVLIVTLHMLRTFFTGSYKKPRQFTWFTGVILLFLTMFLSFSGYLLPWDQLALWAVTIGASMIEAAPPEVVGTNLNLLLRGGPEIGANGLLRFYLLHVLAVPALLFIFTGVHYYKVVIHGHSLPPKEENIGEDTAKRVPLDKRVYFIPDIMTSEIMWIGVTTLVLVVLVTWFFHAPLENHADPQITPLGTTAPWYFLWIQGALKLGDKVLWGIIFPTVYLGFLALLPYIDTTPSRRWAHRRSIFTIVLLLIAATVVLSYMGLAEFGVINTADVDILHHMTMEPAHNHIGLLRPIPFNQLTPGMYTTRQFKAEPGDEVGMIGAFNAELEQPLGAPVTVGNATVRTPEEFIVNYMETQQHLHLPAGLNFVPLPSDATELNRVMKKFYEEIEAEHHELRNGWGGLIISDDQNGLKRLDIFIFWHEVEMERGFPVLNANGESIPVLDANGNPVMRVSSHRVYIHQDSQYFNAPGA
ncbi:MAG: hypothetical protein CUN53_07720 [Phototrophicales bacterium]|nr:MAG: hypothetical protein CUN53_07720 [Phototrophicales bacterium]